MREVLRGRHLKEGVQGKPLCFRLGLGAHWDSEEKKGWAHIEADLTTFRTWLPKEVLDQLARPTRRVASSRRRRRGAAD